MEGRPPSSRSIAARVGHGARALVFNKRPDIFYRRPRARRRSHETVQKSEVVLERVVFFFLKKRIDVPNQFHFFVQTSMAAIAVENASFLRDKAFEVLAQNTPHGTKVFVDPASCGVGFAARWKGVWSLLSASTPVVVHVCSRDAFAYCTDVYRRFCASLARDFRASIDLAGVRLELQAEQCCDGALVTFSLRVESMIVATIVHVRTFAALADTCGMYTNSVWFPGSDSHVPITHIDVASAIELLPPTSILRSAYLDAMQVCIVSPPYAAPPAPLPACSRSPPCRRDLSVTTTANADVASKRDSMGKKMNALKDKLAAIQEVARAKRASVLLHTRQAKVDIRPFEVVPSRRPVLVSMSTQTPTAARVPTSELVSVSVSDPVPSGKGASAAHPSCCSTDTAHRVLKTCRQVQERLFSYRPQGSVCEKGPSKHEIIAAVGTTLDDMLVALPKTFIWCAKLNNLYERVEAELALGNTVSLADHAGGTMDVHEEKTQFFQYMFARVLATSDQLDIRHKLLGCGKQSLSVALQFQQAADDLRACIGVMPVKLIGLTGCSADAALAADRMSALQSVVLGAMLQGARCHAGMIGASSFDYEAFWLAHQNVLQVHAFKFASILDFCFEFVLKHLESKTFLIVRRTLKLLSSGMNQRQCFGMALMCMELKHLLQTVKGLVRFVDWAKRADSEDSKASFQPGSFPPIPGIFMPFVNSGPKK